MSPEFEPRRDPRDLYIGIGVGAAAATASIFTLAAFEVPPFDALPINRPAAHIAELSTEPSPAEAMQVEYEKTRSLWDQWYDHAETVSGDERLTVQGVAAQEYNLSFNDDYNHGDKTSSFDTFLDQLDTATTTDQILEAANTHASGYGFEFVMPKYVADVNKNDDVQDLYPISPADLSTDELRDWMFDLFVNRLNRVPIELIQYSGLQRVYLVNNFSADHITGQAFPDQGSIGINLATIKDAQIEPHDRNAFEHELGHLIHDKLVKAGLITNEDLTIAAYNPKALGRDPACFILSMYDRMDAAKHPGEQGAAIIARLIRFEPMFVKDRDGLNNSVALMVDALQHALPDTKITGFLMAMSKSPRAYVEDNHSMSVNRHWESCQEAVSQPSPTTIPAE